MHNAGIGMQQVRDTLHRVPYTAGMLELLQFIRQHRQLCDAIIVSDANTLFISWILEAQGLGDAFHAVFSNQASIVAQSTGRDLLTILPHHSHTCSRCPVNMCKQRVLRDFVQNQHCSGVAYSQVAYVGDGSNDFCAALGLGVSDVVMARHGMALHKLLLKHSASSTEAADHPTEEKAALACRQFIWSSGLDILEWIREVQFMDGHSRSTTAGT